MSRPNLSGFPERKVLASEIEKRPESWTVVLKLDCGHEMRQVFRWVVRPRHYSNGALSKPRAERLAEVQAVRCIACEPTPRPGPLPLRDRS